MSSPPSDEGVPPEDAAPEGPSHQPASGAQRDPVSGSEPTAPDSQRLPGDTGGSTGNDFTGEPPATSDIPETAPQPPLADRASDEDPGTPGAPGASRDEAASPIFLDDPPAESGVWLAEDDFVGDDSSETNHTEGGMPDGPADPPGPGLPESLLWTGGILGLQVIASVIVATVIAVGLITMSVSGNRSAAPSPAELQKVVSSIQSDHLGMLLCGTQALLVMGVIAASRLRLGRHAVRRLSFHQLTLGHSFAILTLILPLGIVSSQVYVLFLKFVWEPLVNLMPSLRALDDMNTMSQMGELTASMPLPLLLLAIALAPAIAEELVFRGVIGRGLTARWGVVWGVLLTSVLFAIVHMHPVHAAGVFLLGLGMHLVYLATRSFWAPMLVHLTNNSLAAAMAKLPLDPEAAAVASEQPQHPLVILAAVLLVAAIGWYFWKSRIEYRLPDGRQWDPGYFTVEPPPENSAATRYQHSAGTLPVALILLAMMHFVIMLGTFSPVAKP